MIRRALSRLFSVDLRGVVWVDPETSSLAVGGPALDEREALASPARTAGQGLTNLTRSGRIAVEASCADAVPGASGRGSPAFRSRALPRPSPGHDTAA